MSVTDVLLHEKPKKLLRFIRRKNNVSIYEVASGTDTAYAHTYNLIKKLSDAGIISTVKSGRRIDVSITERGKKICRLIDEIEKIADGSDSDDSDASVRKLERYRIKAKEIAERGISGECRNACMLLGRYRQIVRRMRPRSKEGRKMRREVLKEIEDALCRMKR